MNRKRGFSLIELVIVIVILAVISAIALPRISRGAKGADESALSQNLAILRSSIELYAAEHGGNFPGPDAAGFVAKMTTYSDKSGATVATKDTTHPFGPYLQRIPPLSVGANTGKNTVTVAATDPVPGGTTGWVYSTTTGVIIPNCVDTELSEAGTKYNSW